MDLQIKLIFRLFIAVSITATSCLILFGCSNQENNRDIIGIYQLQIPDSLNNAYVAPASGNILIQKDSKITYQTTLNNKPHLDIKGTYRLMEDNKLLVEWQSGKLPDTILIQQSGQQQVIRVGNTLYLKK